MVLHSVRFPWIARASLTGRLHTQSPGRLPVSQGVKFITSIPFGLLCASSDGLASPIYRSFCGKSRYSTGTCLSESVGWVVNHMYNPTHYSCCQQNLAIPQPPRSIFHALRWEAVGGGIVIARYPSRRCLFEDSAGIPRKPAKLLTENPIQA